jgi:2-keto-4-pentenoate hydratase/2-oxohepta-3-ene-1,7-dioic acid hydratase in catechol pathway
VKLASFRADERDRVGLVLADGIVDLAGVVAASNSATDAAQVPAGDMNALIRAGEHAQACLRRAYAYALASPERLRKFAAAEIVWQPPVRYPSKIVCLAINNRALDAIKIKAPADHPAFFLKPSTALVGHLQPIRLRTSFGLTHPEPELAVIIGRELKHVTPEAALAGVFGFSIMNDVTSVGMREEDSFTLRYFKPDGNSGALLPGEAHTSYPGRYKASDTFAPMGPYVVTADEIPNPGELKISCRLGERLVASDNTKNYVWDVAHAIAHVTRTMTLLAGDIISMGTGVGGEPNDPRAPGIPSITKVNLLGFGGLVSVAIDGLGTLSNPILTDAG